MTHVDDEDTAILSVSCEPDGRAKLALKLRDSGYETFIKLSPRRVAVLMGELAKCCKEAQ